MRYVNDMMYLIGVITKWTVCYENQQYFYIGLSAKNTTSKMYFAYPSWKIEGLCDKFTYANKSELTHSRIEYLSYCITYKYNKVEEAWL